MLRWSDFAKVAPEIAEAGLSLTTPNEVALLATVSSGGRPRLHPFVFKVVEGRAVAFILTSSPKKRDLDERKFYTIHAQPGPEDEEFMISGKARCIDDEKAYRPAALKAMGFVTDNDAHETLYEFLIDRALWTRWAGFGTPEHRPVRKVWTEAKGLQSA